MKIEVIHLHEGASNATLTAYIQESCVDSISMGSRPAVIICPGGAYIGITEKEAEPVALRFVSAGFHAFVLRYSIGAGWARFPAPFIDAAKAVMLVRKNAGKWGVDPGKIALCGFSTGGMVAAMLAATWQEEYLAKALNENNQLFRPNALLLGYPLLDMKDFMIKNIYNTQLQPVIEMIFTAVYGMPDPGEQLMDEWNCIKRITPEMLPVFLWTTSEDKLVNVEQSLEFIKALAVNSVSFEYHVFEKGAHGLSLGDNLAGYTDSDMLKLGNNFKWVDLALNWLKVSQGF